MASFDGSVEALQSYLVPIASSVLQSRFANVSALVLQIYDWCRSSNPGFQNVWLNTDVTNEVLCLNQEV